MYASVTTTQFRPLALEELATIYQRLIPTLQATMGWCGVYVLADCENGYSRIVDLWETEADAVAFQASGAYQKLLATELDGLLVGQPQREMCRVLFRA